MSDNSTNNKRIAKNAAALYFRMIIMMLVGLYTSRVILQALGVEDYGIYTVVGGFVSMFSIISSSISATVGRFLTFELGTGDLEKLKRVFSTSILVLIGISILVVIAVETVGLWYLNNKMVIPPDRLNAAFWVFQISLLTFVINLVNTPYNASIISHERMDVYAYLSISDAIIKLIICYVVMVSHLDRLIFYAFLLLLATLTNQVIYVVFCKRKFAECHFKWIIDRCLFQEMFGFAGWNFIGSSAGILSSQGSDLLLNWAGGPLVNAAKGIANNVSSLVGAFVGSFTQAYVPQITKRYAASEFESLNQLIIYGAKYSYYLMFLIALPIAINTEFVLKIWLGVVPEHSVWFCRLILISVLSDTVSKPLYVVKNATGNIRNYQIVVGGTLLLMLPIAYVGLKLGLPVEFVLVSQAIMSLFAVALRIYMLRGDIPLWSSQTFSREVILNVVSVSVLSCIIPFVVFVILPTGWCNFIITSIVSILCTLICMLYVGCSKDERHLLINRAKYIIQRNHK